MAQKTLIGSPLAEYDNSMKSKPRVVFLAALALLLGPLAYAGEAAAAPAKPPAREARRPAPPPEKVAGARDQRRSGMFRRARSPQARALASPASTPMAVRRSATRSMVETRGMTRRNWLT